MDALEDGFRQFASPARRVVVGGDDATAVAVAGRTGKPVWKVGLGPDADLRIEVVERGPGGSVARVRLPNGQRPELRLRVPGLHNLRNASAALAVSLELGADLGSVLAALGQFRGVGRRFDLVGEAAGVVVVDDYAHHEAEIAATLDGARQAYPDRRLVAVFQPHLFTRTRDHGSAMGRALGAADLAVVTEIYPAREQPLPGVSGKAVLDAAVAAGVTAEWVPRRSALVEVLSGLVRDGDLVVTMGAGDVTEVGAELLGRLRGGRS